MARVIIPVCDGGRVRPATPEEVSDMLDSAATGATHSDVRDVVFAEQAGEMVMGVSHQNYDQLGQSHKQFGHAWLLSNLSKCMELPAGVELVHHGGACLSIELQLAYLRVFDASYDLDGVTGTVYANKHEIKSALCRVLGLSEADYDWVFKPYPRRRQRIPDLE